MDLRSLRCFLAVAEELHFGRAARRLHVSQPPLSNTIRQLETRLGVVLFDRSRRRVALTHAGEVLADHARRLLRGIEQAALATQRASRGEIGRLSIGFIFAATHRVLPEILSRFRARMPDVELDLREMPIREQLAALEDGALDIGFVRPPVDTETIAACVLVREAFVAALPQGHRLASHAALRLAHLAAEPFVMFTPGRSPLYAQLMSACSACGFTPNVVQHVAHIVTVIGLVRAGLGVAILPQSVQALRPDGIALRPLQRLTAKAEIAIAWRRDGLSPVAEAFAAIAAETAPIPLRRRNRERRAVG